LSAVLINVNLTRCFYGYRLQFEFCERNKLLAWDKKLNCGLQLCIRATHRHPCWHKTTYIVFVFVAICREKVSIFNTSIYIWII